MYKKVTIAGMGLIGGSIGLALKEKGLAEEVCGWGRNMERLKLALDKGACDTVTTDIKEASAGMEILILATPPEIIKMQLKDIKQYLEKGVLIMDVGSVKESIVEAVEKEGVFNAGAEFLGCHPMAGSEKTGVANAQGAMFENAPCIITPVDENTAEGIDKGKRFWEGLGADIYVIGASEHDLMIGMVSHLPHVVSSVLTKSLTEKINDLKRVSNISGPSFKSMSRVAGSSPELWSQIYMENRKQVMQAIHTFLTELEKFNNMLSEKDIKGIKKYLEEASESRNKIWPSE
ncbi:prephenate dehydrogenase [Elusimicrobiota bacterium]